MRKHGFTIFLVTLVTVISQDALAQSGAPGFQQASATNQESVLSDLRSQPGEKLVVQWQNDRLTVTAHHATLHSVLTTIAKQTGLSIEVSAGADAGLVYVDLGPGTMHDVLSALLDGDPNNYILIGSVRRPGFVERLLLSSVDHTRVVATNEPPAPPPPQPQLYGGGFAAEPDLASNEPAKAAEPHEAEMTSPPAPVPSTVDSSITRYRQTYADMMKNGKTQAEILNELQKQQIRDLDAQVAPQPPQQQ
jgi:hypothetical protein